MTSEASIVCVSVSCLLWHWWQIWWEPGRLGLSWVLIGVCLSRCQTAKTSLRTPGRCIGLCLGGSNCWTTKGFLGKQNCPHCQLVSIDPLWLMVAVPGLSFWPRDAVSRSGCCWIETGKTDGSIVGGFEKKGTHISIHEVLKWSRPTSIPCFTAMLYCVGADEDDTCCRYWSCQVMRLVHQVVKLLLVLSLPKLISKNLTSIVCYLTAFENNSFCSVKYEMCGLILRGINFMQKNKQHTCFVAVIPDQTWWASTKFIKETNHLLTMSHKKTCQFQL